MKNYRLESDEQKAVIRWAAAAAASCPALHSLFAIPNGGWRHITTAKNMKAEGVKPGVPDLFLAVARGGSHGLFVEMKAEHHKPKRESSKGGRSDVQIQWAERLSAEGYQVTTCYGAIHAIETIQKYLAQ